MKWGWNPIKGEKTNIKEWLEEDSDNILIVIENLKVKHTAICIKKSYFLNPHMRDIYKWCSIGNKSLMIEETYKGADFREIGFYLGGYVLVENKQFIKQLTKTNTFRLVKAALPKVKIPITFTASMTPGSYHKIKYKKKYYNVKIPDTAVKGKSMIISHEEEKPMFINQEKLELSQIGLKHLVGKLKLTERIININFPGVTKAHLDLSKAKFEKATTELPLKVVVPVIWVPPLDSGIHQIRYQACFKFNTFEELEEATKYKTIMRATIYVNEFDKNIPYEQEVYFKEVMAQSLYDYSLPDGWDSAMNTYLRTGDDYFKTQAFLDNMHVYGDPTYRQNRNEVEAALALENSIKKKVLKKFKVVYNVKPTKAELNSLLLELLDTLKKASINYAIKEVKDKILAIDKCFVEAAPRVSSTMTNRKYFRGMKGKYPLQNVGDELILKNFTSVSRDIKVAKGFGLQVAQSLKKKENACCLYVFKLAEGIPYINMINTTKFKQEREILLPRDLKATLVKITKNYGTVLVPVKILAPGSQIPVIERQSRSFDLYHIVIDQQHDDQFNLETGDKKFQQGIRGACNHFELGKLAVLNIKGKLTSKTPSKEKPTGEIAMVPKDIDKQLKKQEEVYKGKLPKCPKGTRRNKITKKCEPVKKKSKKASLGFSKTKKSVPSVSKTKKMPLPIVAPSWSPSDQGGPSSMVFSLNEGKEEEEDDEGGPAKLPSPSFEGGPAKLPSSSFEGGPATVACKGLSEAQCNITPNCKYAKGAKRSFCRTMKNTKYN